MTEQFILLIFASHRLWFFWLTQEIFRPIRERLQSRGGWIGYLAGCPVCTSVWVSAFIFLSWIYLGPIGVFLVWALAVSGGIGILNTLNQILEKYR